MIARLLAWFGFRLTHWEDSNHGAAAIERSIQAETLAQAVDRRAHRIAGRMERDTLLDLTGNAWRDELVKRGRSRQGDER